MIQRIPSLVKLFKTQLNAIKTHVSLCVIFFLLKVVRNVSFELLPKVIVNRFCLNDYGSTLPPKKISLLFIFLMTTHDRLNVKKNIAEKTRKKHTKP